jgi:hypothetical protein
MSQSGKASALLIVLALFAGLALFLLTLVDFLALLVELRLLLALAGRLLLLASLTPAGEFLLAAFALLGLRILALLLFELPESGLVALRAGLRTLVLILVELVHGRLSSHILAGGTTPSSAM